MILESISQQFDIWKSTIILNSGDIISNIYNLQTEDTGAKKSNKGGWQSTSFLCNDISKIWAVSFLKDIKIEINNRNYSFTNCWFNINSSDHYNEWHSHGNRPYVGVLYISVPNNSGSIEFRKDYKTYNYNPKEGDFLIFPCSLEHRVLTNKSSKDRISLALNLSA